MRVTKLHWFRMKKNTRHPPPPTGSAGRGQLLLLSSSSVPGRTENIAGLCFASRGISTQADTMEHYEREYEIIRTT